MISTPRRYENLGFSVWKGVQLRLKRLPPEVAMGDTIILIENDSTMAARLLCKSLSNDSQCQCR